MIPEFPASRQITIEDKPLFDSVFAAHPPEISAYTFTNIFAWRQGYSTTLSELDEHILVLQNQGGRMTCLEPLGEGDSAPVMEEVFRRSPEVSSFERVSTTAAEQARGMGLSVEPDRENWDYVYLTEDLVSLAGRKYDAKRNQISRAKAAAAWQYVEMDGRMAMECEDFAERWCEDRQCETVEGLRKENCAVFQMLSNFDRLGIVGGAIRADGAIVAFSLAEALNPDTLVIHAEKADNQIYGLYQLINNELCRAEGADYKYVNREQDLGVPGLRKAKESYHPVRMIETFRVTRR